MENYLIDTHAHIDMIEEPVDKIIGEMNQNGVKKVIIPSVEEKTFDKILKIAHSHENIFAMTGIYPSEAAAYSPELEARMEEICKDSKIKAIGEIGLDYYWDKSFVELQKEVFIKIKGRVQGIGFRWWAVKTANEIGGLSGWVHNEADGSVEIMMRGEEEKIDEMVLACHSGPPLARVDSVSFVVGRWSCFLPPIEEGVFKRF